MKISVLTPIYKPDEGFLRTAIGSVLGQTFTDFELILLDDCPEDDREEVVRGFDDKRIVYLKNERNLGIAASRNRLIDLARGEYLAVFDHDDICMPERFAKQVAYLDAHPECGVVSGWIKPTFGVETRYPEGDHDIKVAMMRGISMWHPAAMIRKSVLESSGIRYEAEYTPVEDYMLWMRLIPHTRFHNLQSVLIDYRWHDRNTSVVRKSELDAQDIRVKSWAKVNLPELYAECEMKQETETRISVLGVPVLKIRSGRRRLDFRLFNCLRIASICRKTMV